MKKSISNKSPTSNEFLRKADVEDGGILLEWANDSITRQNSFNSEQIEYKEHMEFLRKKLNSDNSAWYILCVNGDDVGQIRIEINKNEAVISYSIAPKHRQRGYGKQILVLLEEQIKTEYPLVKVVIGKVKKDNIISQRKFEQLNYQKLTNLEYIEYRKYI